MKKSLRIILVLAAILIGLMALFPEKAATFAVNAERSASGLEFVSRSVEKSVWYALDQSARSSAG